MTKLPYLRTMFSTCMLFQVIFSLCALLWLAYPDLKGHSLLPAIFPNLTLLTIGSFIYGFILSGVYGWVVAFEKVKRTTATRFVVPAATV